jgi:2-polyprenyl-3-methyl-5-hydroxy-6-metoxy-1,4-benzoquinol methylase
MGRTGGERLRLHFLKFSSEALHVSHPRRYHRAMQEQPGSPSSKAAWDQLAQDYAASRQVSADRLIEWPAQLRLCGDIQGKEILDMGCGSGDKARHFAENGAASVLGLDPSAGFAEQWAAHAACSRLTLDRGSFEDLSHHPALRDRLFDLAVCFQALMYAQNLAATLLHLAALLRPQGALVFSVPHPFRFAILKNEIEGWGHGLAYQKTEPYRYPSPWNPAIFLEHATPRVSDYLNAIAAAGLRLTACEEPAVTEGFRALSPEKAAWMDRYVGILIFRTEKTALVV